MDESRKQFAEAFEELTGWELEDYPNQDYADTCWEFWQKSRAAIEIELPKKYFSEAYFGNGCCDDYANAKLDQVYLAVRAAGIKVKE